MKQGSVSFWTPQDLQRLGDETLLIVDTRPPDLYRQGHLRGSLSLFYGQFLGEGGRVFVPSSVLARRLGALGVEREKRLVLYDDGLGMFAGKMLQVLDAVGHPEVLVLNGGITAWCAAGGTLTLEPQIPPPTLYAIAHVGEPLATKEWLLRRLGSPDLLVLDTRSFEEYSGFEKTALRNGHIVGAVHLEWKEVLHFEGRFFPTFLPEPLLRARFQARGIMPEKEIVCYCHRGTRSSSVYLVLRALGFPRVRNYLGSWAEWGNDPSTPVEAP